MSHSNDAPRRLITRADFDGLVCAALLKELDLIDQIVFVHPKDTSDGKVDVGNRDIMTNVPFDERCFLAFDHHASEVVRHGGEPPPNLVLDAAADSAARLVYRYYGGRERFPNISTEMLAAVDKADAARFTREEVLNPSGWVLLNFIMDPRTGLGRFHEFRISNFDLMMKLIDACRTHDIDEILSLPDVAERIDLYFRHEELAIEQIQRCAKVQGNLVVLDLREEKTIYACNRFMVYALFPDCNCSIHVVWGRGALNTVFALGNSIFNRTQPVSIGELCLKYGGGGHAAAGTLQVPHAEAERVLGELIEFLRQTAAAEARETQVDDEELVALDGDEAESKEQLIESLLGEAGQSLLATKQDIREIHERLARIERMLVAIGSPTVQ